MSFINSDGDAVDWSPESIFNREENWLNSNNQVIPVRMFMRRSDSRPSGTNLSILRVRSCLNHYLLYKQTTRFLDNVHFMNNQLDEPNVRIFYGFVLGALMNIYTIIFLLFCNFKKKFRFGLQIGMIFGVFMVILYNLYYK